jgi:Tfp pilus assembly protein PilN
VSKQINLLGQVEAAPDLSAQRVLAGLGVIVAAFLLYGGFSWFQAAQLGGTLKQTTAELETEKAKVKDLELKLGARPKLANIIADINALKAQRDDSQIIMDLLRGGASDGNGYSRQLTTLARISEEGVWIKSLTISPDGKSVKLSGWSLRGESVLRYAQRLNEQFSAYGVQFAAVELTPDPLAGETAGPKPAPVVGFRLY